MATSAANIRKKALARSDISEEKKNARETSDLGNLEISEADMSERRTRAVRCAVKKFIYGKGKFCQRTPYQWGCLILFYTFLYFGAAAVWLGSFFVFWTFSINLQSPMKNSELETGPGLNMIPLANDRWGTFVYYNRASWPQENRTIHQLAAAVDEYEINWGQVEGTNQADKDWENAYDVKTCKPGDGATRIEACIYNTDVFGNDCFKYKTFDLDAAKPCWLFKLNKVYNWQPTLFNSTTQLIAAGFPSEKPWNQAVLGAFDPDFIPFTCGGKTAIDEELLGEDIEYMPPKGFPAFHFPYLNQRHFRSPPAIVKFNSIALAVPVFITCKIWAQNVHHSLVGLSQIPSGSFSFEMMVDNAKPLYYHKDYTEEDSHALGGHEGPPDASKQ